MDPDEDTLGRMQQLKLEEQEKKELLQTLKGRENITIDGKKIMLYANIGNSKDLAAVLQNDAGGIGLFRSEFIYLERDTFPTEEEQFQIYRTVAETMAGKHLGNDLLGLSGYPYLSDQTGNLQDTAACTIPRQRLWQYFHYVSHDHQCRGSAPDQGDRYRGEAGTDRTGSGFR